MPRLSQRTLCFVAIALILLLRAEYIACNFNNDEFYDGNRVELGEQYEQLEEEFSNFDGKLAQPLENPFWRGPDNLGEISGISVDPLGRPVIFHRGNRVWEYNTFNENAEYQEEYRGPIVENTVLTLNPITGEVIHGWGNQTFYLPHGIHIDGYGNIWLTDVALHQVFKFREPGVPQLILGERFQPGSDLQHFCKPTTVAVASNDDIFVADGYCNHRILVFDRNGNPKYNIGKPWIYFHVPHSLTILPNQEVCVADRENWRVICFNMNLLGTKEAIDQSYSIRHRQLGRIFGITSYDGIIYGVNGRTSRKIHARGFTMNPDTRSVVSFWGPETGTFTRPHAIATCPNGTAIYITEIGPNKVWKFDLIKINMI